MDINSWLTVITIYSALIALLPRDEFNILFANKNKLFYFLLIINIFIVPFLIYFKKILQILPYLEYFTFNKGILPKDLAFILFYISFILFSGITIFNKFKLKANNKNIEQYLDLLHNKSFQDFFKLFTKYTYTNDIVKQWHLYKRIIFSPLFLKKIVEYRPSYLFRIWPLFNTKKEFRQIFELFLNNKNSNYYTEIKENANSSCIQENKPFLKTVIIDSLKQSIDNGVFLILTDYIRQELNRHNNNLEIYNQEHYSPRVRENENYNLPIYYHISFIDLLYSYAIHSKIDISTISKKYTNQPSIFSSIIALIIENISLSENTDLKYSTNFHWLIKEIFHIQSEWIQKIGCSYDDDDDNFNIDNSYISFIPTSIQLCLKELYKGIEKQKIDIDFLNEIVSDNIFNYYFNSCFDLTIKKEIDKKILKTIPSVYKNTIINYSINKILGLSLVY